MTWMLLVMLAGPGLLFALVSALFATPDETPRWRVAAARRLERLARRLRREHTDVPDPFAALRVQTRLGAVARHVLSLEYEPHTFALAERLIASQLAYDQLLAEACALAGVEVLPRAKGDPQERFREEVELASRGWSW
ncbi:MAG: hypothetical protein ACOH17_04220 [Cellulomonas sp.]